MFSRFRHDTYFLMSLLVLRMSFESLICVVGEVTWLTGSLTVCSVTVRGGPLGRLLLLISAQLFRSHKSVHRKLFPVLVSWLSLLGWSWLTLLLIPSLTPRTHLSTLSLWLDLSGLWAPDWDHRGALDRVTAGCRSPVHSSCSLDRVTAGCWSPVHSSYSRTILTIEAPSLKDQPPCSQRLRCNLAIITMLNSDIYSPPRGSVLLENPD